jgi:hypothetical protein
MNILGSIFSFENIIFNCYKKNDKSFRDNEYIKSANKNLTNISVLPLVAKVNIRKIPINKCITNLTTIVIGTDDNFVSLKVNGELKKYFNEELLLNKVGINILTDEMNNLIVNTIKLAKIEKNIQMFFTLNNVLYFLNTYQLLENEMYLGMVIFIRPYSYIYA